LAPELVLGACEGIVNTGQEPPESGDGLDRLVRWLINGAESERSHVRASACAALVVCFSMPTAAPAHPRDGPGEAGSGCCNSSCSLHSVDHRGIVAGGREIGGEGAGGSGGSGCGGREGSSADAGIAGGWRWEWVKDRVQERYAASRPADSGPPEASAAEGGAHAARAKGKPKPAMQMVLPPASSQVDASEALRMRLAAGSMARVGSALSASTLSKPMDLSILHAKKKALPSAAQRDANAHVRVAALQVLQAWVEAQGAVYARESLACELAARERLLDRLASALSFLLGDDGPFRDAHSEVWDK